MPSYKVILFVLFSLVLCSSVLSAAQKKKGEDFDRGLMQARKDAKLRFVEQKDFVQQDYAVRLVGVYVWGGRADKNYMPFHQWEIALQVDEVPAKLRIKIIPLDGHLQPQKIVKPHWQDVEGIKVGEQYIFSYKLNCSAVRAYRLLLEDDKSQREYFAGDLMELPQLPLEGMVSDIVISEVDFEYSKKRKRTAVMFFLANIGKKDATGVSHTLYFKDAEGEVIHSEEYIPEQGILVAGYQAQQKLIFKKVPPFKTISISTSKDEEYILEENLEAPSGDLIVADLSLSQLRIEEGVLKGIFMNTSEVMLKNITVYLEVENQSGELREFELGIAELESKASYEMAEQVDISSFMSYGFSYQAE